MVQTSMSAQAQSSISFYIAWTSNYSVEYMSLQERMDSVKVWELFTIYTITM